jgi:hypothetical protein
MIKWFVTFAVMVTITAFAPTPLMAQGVGVEVPGVGGVRVGEPYRRYRDYDRDYDRRYYRERRYGGGCKTITIQRDDGSMKRIRRCDYD